MTADEKKRYNCERMVEALVGKQHAQLWWSSRNKAFGNETPFVAYELNPDQVYDYLAWHCYGGMG